MQLTANCALLLPAALALLSTAAPSYAAIPPSAWSAALRRDAQPAATPTAPLLSAISSIISSSSSAAASASAVVGVFGTPDWPSTPNPDTVPVSGPPLTNLKAAKAAQNGAAKVIKQETVTHAFDTRREHTAHLRHSSHGDPLANLAHRRSHHHHKSAHRMAKETTHQGHRHAVAQHNRTRSTGANNSSSSAVMTTSGMLTWYAGKSLLNPACGGSDPTDDSLIGAVSHYDSQIGGCGDVVKIVKDGNVVTVKIRDWCASCGPYHMDVTKGVFKQIATLDQGVVNGVTMFKLQDGSNSK